MMNRLFCRCLTLLLTLACCISELHALPPLGLTQVSTDPTLQPNLEVIDGTAYLGVADGVWTLDTLGSQTFTPISHPTLGTPSSVTRVVKATDNQLYVAASYGNFNSPQGGALYNLEQPTTPSFSWSGNYLMNGVDRERVVYGNVVEPSIGFEASRFHLDGSIETLPYPPGSDSSNNTTRLDFVTPSSNAIGSAGIPGTAGAAPVMWAPAGDFSFVFGFGVVTSIRDRADGQGINIGADLTDPTLKLGQKYYYLADVSGDYLYVGDGGVIVSQSDFVVFEASPTTFMLDYYAFYPGIVPGFPDRAMPLLDVFPELAAIDIDTIHDLASIDGYLYMTLSGADGTFLFGARDPSLVPEPATLALMLAMVVPGVLKRV